MPRHRLVPCLLLDGGGLWKTERFASPRYVGDPVNTARLFNEKHADELIVLDVGATVAGRGPDLDLVGRIATECFMPVCYGGGVRTVEDFRRLYAAGVEKVAVNAAAVDEPRLVTDAAAEFGSQSVVVSIDVRGGRVVTHRATTEHGHDPVAQARWAADAGAGELLLTAVDREGTGAGLDLELVGAVAGAVRVPVVAHGGAGDLTHVAEAYAAGASAVAAGSMFVYHGRRRAVLVTYPDPGERG